MDDNKTTVICVSALLIAIVAIVVSVQVYFSKKDARWAECPKNARFAGECARMKCIDEASHSTDRLACMTAQVPAAQ